MLGVVVRVIVICVPLVYGAVHGSVSASMAVLTAALTSAKGYSPSDVTYLTAGTVALVETAIALVR